MGSLIEKNNDEEELKGLFNVVEQIFWIIALMPLTLSIWVFHHNRVLIQNSDYDDGIKGLEMAKPLIEQWERYRSLGYILLVTMLVLTGLLILLARKNRNQYLYSFVSSLVVRLVLSLLTLTFSFAIGVLLTDIYLIFINL